MVALWQPRWIPEFAMNLLYIYTYYIVPNLCGFIFLYHVLMAGQFQVTNWKSLMLKAS